MRRAWVTAGVATVLAFGLTGCLGIGGDEDKDSGSSAKAVARGDVRTIDPNKTIAKATFNPSGVKGAKLDVGIVGLNVSGKLLHLTMAYTVQGVPTEDTSLYRLNGQSSVDVNLLDPAGLKRYTVVKDSGGKELQTDYVLTKIVNNQPAVFQYTFAAPPENVKTLDVSVGQWGPFRDVPVNR